MFQYLFQLDSVVTLIQTLACVTVIIDAIEIIYERHQYGTNGIYNYNVLQTYRKWMLNKWILFFANFLFKHPRYIFLIVVQLAASILLISHLFIDLSLPLVLIILIVHLLSHLRNQYGLDGSDQMQVIIFASLAIYYATTDEMVKELSVYFICFQLLLSYATAGFQKLISPKWLLGKAISGILNTTSYGNKKISQMLLKNPKLSLSVCWFVILFECTFPLVVFTGTTLTVIMVIIGIGFHLSIALLMRLNSFFWSFVATYPAVLFFANEFQKLFYASN